MELYVLDDLLRRDTVVDVFESLIWTERWASVGEFQLQVPATPQNRQLFTSEKRLAVNKSKRVMTVETLEDSSDNEGRKTLLVKGPSLEETLDNRAAVSKLTSTTIAPQWELTGTPGAILRDMFQAICVAGSVSPFDIIPFYQTGTLYPQETIPEPADVITLVQEPDSLYNAIKKVCDIYELGFRLYRDPNTSKIMFNIYTGNDRTTAQTVLPAVVFSEGMDNLQNTTALTTVEKTKNCAYVYYENQFLIVYPDGVDPEVDGFERRVLIVHVDAIPEGVTDIPAYMWRRGMDELALVRSFTAFDGEIDQRSSYRYEIDYNLGDLVEVRSASGASNNMRVTEQIFVHDREGERAYPTLAVNLAINPGSWLSWVGNQVWTDLGATEYWANQD